MQSPSAKQKAVLGSKCAEALFRYNATRTRKPHAERLADKRSFWRKKTYEIRLEMVAAYGGKCCQCGEDDPIVLVLDHIGDDAKADRRANGHKGGWMMYQKLKKRGWPKDVHQLLCQNCNFRKEYKRRRAYAVS